MGFVSRELFFVLLDSRPCLPACQPAVCCGYMKHLDSSWELENPGQTTLLSHLYDTIEALGGWKGLLVLFVGVGIFHGIVEYVISSGRKKRQEAKRRLQERKEK